MSCVPLMTREAQYLLIKQKLDSYNISSSFPLQMMPLLHNLITRLDRQVNRNRSNSISSYASSLNQVKQLTLSFGQVQPALRSEVQQTLSLNNQLHLELMTQKEEIQSLKHCIGKLSMQVVDPTKKNEIDHVIRFYQDKEKQLIEQLQSVKFKYNQLVDFVMGEDHLEKLYIKKLINHKKYQITQAGETKKENSQNHNINQLFVNQPSQDLNSRITFKAGSSRQKQSRKRINKTTDGSTTVNDHLQNNTSSNQQSDHLHKIHTLKSKLQNREKQIQRLHAVISHEGPNLNKVMTQFTHQLQQKKYHEMQQRIELLEEQNQRVKNVLEKSKNTGGRYQALLQEVQKCHSVIENLKKQNSQLKRNSKQQLFDFEKEKQEISRSLNLNNSKHNQLKIAKYSDNLTLEELKKKIQFYQKELGYRQIFQTKQVKKLKKDTIKTTKKSIKKTYKESEKMESKIFKEEQILESEQREKYENEIKLQNKKTLKKAKYIKQKVKKGGKKLPISQILEESQEDSEIKEDKQQKNEENQQSNEINQHLNVKNQENQQSINQKEKNEKKGEQEKESQQEESSSQQQEQGQERNETMIQQYEQTMNDLSSRCLQLREQLESKNQTIKGLEQIANRLMSRQGQQSTSNPESSLPTTISHLQQQVSTVSCLLNESEFQKQQLRRELIELQSLYKQSLQQQQSQSNSEQAQSHKELSHLHRLIEQKDKKIQEMRQDNMTIQDKLFKALDRIRRLNDQVDAVGKEKLSMTEELQTITKQKDSLVHQLKLNQTRLEEAAALLKQQRERHTSTLELSEIQKNEIILLRKNLLLAQGKNNELEQLIQALKQQNQRLVHQLR